MSRTVRPTTRRVAPRLCALENRLTPDSTAGTLATANLSQNWSDTSLITVDNDWSGVPGIQGFAGIGLGVTGGDPQLAIAPGSGTDLNVRANRINTNQAGPGGTAEFDFPADLEGVFEVELHHSGEQIAELTINP